MSTKQRRSCCHLHDGNYKQPFLYKPFSCVALGINEREKKYISWHCREKFDVVWSLLIFSWRSFTLYEWYMATLGETWNNHLQNNKDIFKKHSVLIYTWAVQGAVMANEPTPSEQSELSNTVELNWGYDAFVSTCLSLAMVLSSSSLSLSMVVICCFTASTSPDFSYTHTDKRISTLAPRSIDIPCVLNPNG